jgi:hypothetical protein
MQDSDMETHVLFNWLQYIETKYNDVWLKKRERFITRYVDSLDRAFRISEEKYATAKDPCPRFERRHKLEIRSIEIRYNGLQEELALLTVYLERLDYAMRTVFRRVSSMHCV